MTQSHFITPEAVDSPDIWRWHAWQMAQAIAQGDISSREAVGSCLQRIEAVNGRVNALPLCNPKEALALADLADAARASGQVLGPLHGVPISIKLNVDVTGQPTTDGALSRQHALATDTSPVVTRLQQSGAVVLARSNVPAFSFRWFCDNDLHGQTLNPWNDQLTPGGSSGGAAAAVAAGMCPLSHGNDIGGSIRYPSYACGVAGLRPTSGRIPTYNFSQGDKVFSFQHFLTQGPIARCIQDLRLGFEAMAGYHPLDPDSVPKTALGAATPPCRVALMDDFGGLPMAPEVQQALEAAARWLSDAGYNVERQSLPGLGELVDLYCQFVMTEIEVLGFSQLIEQEGDLASQKAVGGMFARAGERPTLQSYIQGFMRRDSIRRAWNLVFEQFPIMLMPTSLQLPFVVDYDLGGDAVMADIMAAQTTMLAIPLLNYPTVCVPTGVHAGNVPVGVQIAAGPYQEARCLDAAQVIEARARMPLPW